MKSEHKSIILLLYRIYGAQHKIGVEMAKKKVLPEVIIHNFVAKNMYEVNQSQVFVDRKKNLKRGYTKHKKGRYSNDYLPFSIALMINHHHHLQNHC